MTMSRRRFLNTGSAVLGSAAAALAAGCATGGPSARGRRTYLLVHGAWHGGWCWARVTPALRAAGHDVHVITLTGLGDRAHLNRPDINLDTHIQDVVAYLEMEDLGDIVLVGHSYAGMVITGVADRASARLRSLLYLDAFVPENGKAMVDYIAASRRAAFIKAGSETGMSAPLPLKLFGVTAPEDLAWATPRIGRQSFQTFAQPIRLANGNLHLRLPRTYVYCSNPPTGSFDEFAARIRTDPGWKFIELKTGHDAMIIAPQGVARVLLEAA